MAVQFIYLTENKFLQKYPYIYHYTSIKFLDSIIVNNSHYFNSPLNWADPYEKYFLNPLYRLPGSAEDKYLPIKHKVLCKCFTRQYQSEPYWKRSDEEDASVCLKYNTAKLIEELNALEDYNVYIGNVRYVGEIVFSKNLPNKRDLEKVFKLPESSRAAHRSQLWLLLLKRLAFSYEKEIRIFLIPKNMETVSDALIKFGSPIRNIIPEITFDPRLRDEDGKCSERYRKLKETYGPSSEYKIRCKLSNLYRDRNRVQDDYVIVLE